MSSPSSDFNIKKFMETREYQNKRAEMQHEINSYPVVIDYACFKKTQQEKAQLATAKMQYKALKKAEALQEQTIKITQ